MKRCLIAAILATAAVCSECEANVTLDLQRSADLKALFDGGLRPTLTPGLERSQVQAGPDTITVVLPSGKMATTDVANSSFDVLADQRLSSAALFGKEQSIRESADTLRKLCHDLEIPTAGFDEMIGSLGAAPDPTKYWTRQNVADGNVTVQVTWQPIFHYGKATTARVNVYLNWKRSGEPMRFSQTEIQPPQGYEAISMHQGSPSPNPNPVPQHDMAYYHRAMEPQGVPQQSPPAASASASSVARGEGIAANQHVATHRRRLPTRSILLIVTLAAIGAFLIVTLWQRRSHWSGSR